MFTTREVAVAIWAGIALALAISRREIRSSFQRVLKAFFQPAIVTIFLLMIAYVIAIILTLNYLALWSPGLIKDTVLWFLFAAVPLAFSSFSSRTDGSSLGQILLDALRLTVLVEFLVNSYTFSLPVELIFVPLVTLIMMIGGYASAYEKYSRVASIFKSIQAVIGLGILAFVISRVIVDLANLLTVHTAQELLLPPVMSILLIPFIYSVLVFLSYEQLFIVLKVGQPKRDSLVTYAKQRLVVYLKLSVSRIRRFHRAHGPELTRIQTKEDFDKILDASDER